ncbi:MAG: hypothetical protein M1818_005036 [Claussenomyces sp. TS43310]|nr:MAG: hypothetical protein M1818_005036 [Claussenomyces sp. TS43310]
MPTTVGEDMVAAPSTSDSANMFDDGPFFAWWPWGPNVNNGVSPDLLGGDEDLFSYESSNQQSALHRSMLDDQMHQHVGTARNDTPFPLSWSPSCSPAQLNMDSRSISGELHQGISPSGQEVRESLNPTISGLPAKQYIRDLVDLFFVHLHHRLPCIDQDILLQRLSEDYVTAHSCPLLWIIMATAAPMHPDENIRSCQGFWWHRAGSLFDTCTRTFQKPKETLQAAVWLTYHSFTMARMAEAWTILGTACRLASLFAWDRIDSTRTQPSPFTQPAGDEHENEQRRRTIWALFFLDRIVSSLYGSTLAFDDRQFCVNFPMENIEATSNGHLPGIGPTEMQPSTEIFTRDLASYFSTSGSSTTNDQRLSLSRLVLKLAVLLGRIVTHHNQLHVHSSLEIQSHEADFTDMEHALTRLYIIVARSGYDILRAPEQDLRQVVWLHIMLRMCSILLYHPTVGKSPHRSLSYDDDGPGFQRCANSTRDMIHIIGESARRSIDALLNPLLLPAYFLCSRFLAIDWHERKTASSKTDIDLILMLLDRMAEQWPQLVTKYRTSIMSDLSKTIAQVQQMRIGNGSYLGDMCGRTT